MLSNKQPELSNILN